MCTARLCGRSTGDALRRRPDSLLAPQDILRRKLRDRTRLHLLLLILLRLAQLSIAFSFRHDWAFQISNGHASNAASEGSPRYRQFGRARAVHRLRHDLPRSIDNDGVASLAQHPRPRQAGPGLLSRQEKGPLRKAYGMRLTWHVAIMAIGRQKSNHCPKTENSRFRPVPALVSPRCRITYDPCTETASSEHQGRPATPMCVPGAAF